MGSCTITLEENGIFVSSNGLTRYIPANMFIDILFNVFNQSSRDTGLLPPGTRQVISKGNSALYIVELPGSVQPVDMILSVAGTYRPLFHVPVALPPLLFAVHLMNSESITVYRLNVFAYQPPLTVYTELLMPPLPNLYESDCRVCLGDPVRLSSSTYSGVAAEAVSYFFSSRFNTDLSSHLSHYLHALLDILVDDYTRYINPDSPLGRYLLDHYHGAGPADLARTLFSGTAVDLFYDAYADMPDRAECADASAQLLSQIVGGFVTRLESSSEPSIPFTTLLPFRHFYLLPTIMVMSMLRVYPTSILTPCRSTPTYDKLIGSVKDW